MAKIGKDTGLEQLMKLMDQYDPEVRKLAQGRCFNRVRGAQLFNPQTHRLKKHLRDESQAIAVLVLAVKIAQIHGFRLKLSVHEEKLLRGFGEPIQGKDGTNPK